MADAASTLIPALAMALVHFLWQGAVIGALAWAALHALRDARPQLRYAVACAALLACVLLPAWGVARGLPGGFDTPATPALTTAFGSAAPVANGADATPFDIAFGASLSTHPALPWLVWLWATGACLLLLRMGGGVLWVGAQRRGGYADAQGAWQHRIDTLALRMGVDRTVTLRLCRDGDSPLSAGLWRPFVLLPVSVAAGMPVALVEALLAHELAHVRRHDYLINLLQGVAEALLFYHPVAWWLSGRIRIERELVADDLAAHALGDRRRLALALAELDRIATPRSVSPAPHIAQAAHGGQLMSRIRQLVRPTARNAGIGALLPLGCLALAAIAFCAHALEARPAPPAFVRAAAAAIPAATALPAPAASSANGALDAKPGTTARATQLAAVEQDEDASGYALVRKGKDGFTMSGSLDDVDTIRAAQRSLDSDFIWLRRDGKAWIVDDPAVIARAEQAWAAMRPLEARMQALETQMRPHSARMEQLSEQMAALQVDNVFESPETRAASARIEALGEQMEALSVRQVALAERVRGAGDAAAMARFDRESEGLEREREQIEQAMERHTDTLHAQGERMQAQQQPMEALGRQMEAAGKPMEAIGRDMEAMGARIERESRIADAAMQRLIDDATARGLLRPAPSEQ